MNKNKIILSMLCFLLAIFLLCFPFLKERITEKQNEIRKDYLLGEITEIMKNETPTDSFSPNMHTTSISNKKPYRTATNESVDGILYIDSINLELPILSNVSENGLKKTCARVTNTEPPGCSNYCIMGHHYRNYGAIFNRLNEVKIGDKISVKAYNGTYDYIVTKTFITEGFDASILEDVKNKQIITLFSCDYSRENGRFVVRGELIN